MRLFLIDMSYPHRRVALNPGCEKTAWSYKWVGRLPVFANNPVVAVEMFLAHLETCSSNILEKHVTSCRVYVSEHPNDGKPGIKFSINGNPDLVYRVRKSDLGYWPVLSEDL